MAIGLNPEKERVFLLKEDRELPVDQQTRWFFKLLRYDAYVRSQDGLVEFRGDPKTDDQRTIVLSGSQESTILCEGLIRCENFRDEDGTELQVPEGRDKNNKMKFLSYLKPAWRRELAQAILGDSDLGEAKEKPSNSQSGSADIGTVAA